jgi:hypothetical protein
MRKVHKKKLFYVYVDFTTELNPRPFYVGKGVQSRVRDKERNIVHTFMSNSHGFHRRIIFETFDETQAFDVECIMIKQFKTWSAGGSGWWGANHDLGGQGGCSTPKTKEHCAKIASALRGKKKTKDHCQAMSRGGKGKKLSRVHKKRISVGAKLASKAPAVREAKRRGAINANKLRWDRFLFRKKSHAWFNKLVVRSRRSFG